MESMEIFYRQLRELVASYNIERLLFFKRQLEDELARIGDDPRLLEKYNAICKAIEQFQEKKSA
jgi:hypothetical protein